MLAKQAKILIADDMRVMRRSMSIYLNELGYDNIIEAESGDKALEMYRDERPDFIFMDIVMPDVKGDEVLTRIRAADKQTPIVMLTSVNTDSIINYCRKQGILDFILKPLTANTGPQRISEIFSKVQ